MAHAAVAKHALARASSGRFAVVLPSPDDELYQCACDLVKAAVAIRQLAGGPGAARAVPALLRRLEAALHELGGACAGLAATIERAKRRLLTRTKPTPDAGVAPMRRHLNSRELASFEAESAAMAARFLAARSLRG